MALASAAKVVTARRDRMEEEMDSCLSFSAICLWIRKGSHIDDDDRCEKVVAVWENKVHNIDDGSLLIGIGIDWN